MTDTAQKEPDWKAIAFELASLLDDIDLQFQAEQYSSIEGRARLSGGESPKEMFLIKKFIAAQKYFRRHNNQLMHIDEWNKAKKDEQNRLTELRNAFKIKP